MTVLEKKNDKKIWTVTFLMAFCIPLAITCIAYALNGIVPFGDNTVLIWDAKLQYKDYFGYLWDVLHGDASMHYSAAKSLGGQMIGLIAYYLTCPLNLLIYFFKKSQIGLFFSLLTLLKISFSGVTANYFIKKRYNLSPFFTLLLSTSYALMEYNVYYCRNIMWLDGAVMLPLVCLGVYEMLYNRKKGLLFGSVAVAILSNWYTGFMVCLMAGFYFLFELILKYDWRKFKEIFTKAFSDCIAVAADMILGVCTSAVILLPACMTLIGGKASFKLALTGMNFDWFYTLSGFDINASVNTKTSPILYCGGLAVVLFAYLLFDNRIKIKTRLVSLGFFFFMTLGFCLKSVELMWTAFVKSNSYNFRFAFVFAFSMLVLASTALKEIQNNGNRIHKPAALKALLLIGAFVLLLVDTHSYKNSRTAIIYSLVYVVYAATLVVLFNGKKPDFKKYVCAAMALLLLFSELGVNSYLAYRDYDVSNSVFSSYTQNMQNLVDEIKQQDSSFFRFEKNYSYLSEIKSDVATCEPLLFNYNSIEHYSSTYDVNVDEFLARMGYSDSTYVPDENAKEGIIFPTDAYWNSPMLLTDSLLGVKYEMWKDLPHLEMLSMNAELPEGYSVFKNSYALPLAYNISDNAAEKPEYTLNPFENQKLLLSVLMGKEVHPYIEPAVSRQPSEQDTEQYVLTANTSGPMYLYIDGSQNHKDRYNDNCHLSVNGKFVQKMCSRFNYNAVYIGDYNKGDEVQVEIQRVSKNEKERLNEHTMYTAQLDMQAFQSIYNSLSSGYETNLNIQENKILGEYKTADDSTVMLTVPFTTGWTVYVDGQKAAYKEIAGIFIGLELNAGTHTIEMVYKTQYLNIAALLTLAGIGGFSCWTAVELVLKRRKKHKNQSV